MFERLFGRKRKPRILAVDDDPHIAGLVKTIMEGRGCKVDIAPDGDQALKQFQSKKYDLIILDVRMPGRDGLETLEMLRLLPGGAKQNVIMLTSESIMTTFNRAFELGALDYIAKPFALKDLVTKVETYLSKKA